MYKKTAYYGVFIALAVILSYVESLVPIPVPIPGFKLGLANVVIVFLLYSMGEKDTLIVSILRIIIVGVLFGGVSAVIYSLAGGLLSFSAMILCKRLKLFGVVGVSVAGGVFHNIGQILIATVVVENINLLYYMPPLILSGEVTGVLVGVISYMSLKHARGFSFEN